MPARRLHYYFLGVGWCRSVVRPSLGRACVCNCCHCWRWRTLLDGLRSGQSAVVGFQRRRYGSRVLVVNAPRVFEVGSGPLDHVIWKVSERLAKYTFLTLIFFECLVRSFTALDVLGNRERLACVQGNGPVDRIRRTHVHLLWRLNPGWFRWRLHHWRVVEEPIVAESGAASDWYNVFVWQRNTNWFISISFLLQKWSE